MHLIHLFEHVIGSCQFHLIVNIFYWGVMVWHQSASSTEPYGVTVGSGYLSVLLWLPRITTLIFRHHLLIY